MTLEIEQEMEQLETEEEFVDWFNNVLDPMPYLESNNLSNIQEAIAQRISGILAVIIMHPDKYLPQFMVAILNVLSDSVANNLMDLDESLEEIADGLMDYQLLTIKSMPDHIQKFIIWAEEALTRAYNMPVTCECGVKLDHEGDELMVFNFCGKIEQRKPGQIRADEGAILVLPLRCTQDEAHFREQHLATIEGVIMEYTKENQ